MDSETSWSGRIQELFDALGDEEWNRLDEDARANAEMQLGGATAERWLTAFDISTLR